MKIRLKAPYMGQNEGAELEVAQTQSHGYIATTATGEIVVPKEVCDVIEEEEEAPPAQEPPPEPMVVDDPTEELAHRIYDAYCAAVGGKAFNGDPLPASGEFFADLTKTKQANAWRFAAMIAVGTLSGEEPPLDDPNQEKLPFEEESETDGGTEPEIHTDGGTEDDARGGKRSMEQLREDLQVAGCSLVEGKEDLFRRPDGTTLCARELSALGEKHVTEEIDRIWDMYRSMPEGTRAMKDEPETDDDTEPEIHTDGDTEGEPSPDDLGVEDPDDARG